MTLWQSLKVFTRVCYYSWRNSIRLKKAIRAYRKYLYALERTNLTNDCRHVTVGYSQVLVAEMALQELESSKMMNAAEQEVHKCVESLRVSKST